MGECLIIRRGGIDSSDATATADKVLTGYSCYANDSYIEGTMNNQSGLADQTLDPGGSYTIPMGYHDGNTKVGVSALSGSTSANAAAANILSGYTGWVNGSLVTGTMTNRGTVNKTLAANSSYTIPAGWHSGSGKVTQSLTTQAGKTVTPKTSNQTVCAASRWTTGNVIIAGASTLTATNIKNNVTIFGVKGTCTNNSTDYKSIWKGSNVGDGSSNGTTIYPTECQMDGRRESTPEYVGVINGTGTYATTTALFYEGSAVSGEAGDLTWVYNTLGYTWFNFYNIAVKGVNNTATDFTYRILVYCWTKVYQSTIWGNRTPTTYDNAIKYGLVLYDGTFICPANSGTTWHRNISKSLKPADVNSRPQLVRGVHIRLCVGGTETLIGDAWQTFTTDNWATFAPSYFCLYYTADKHY